MPTLQTTRWKTGSGGLSSPDVEALACSKVISACWRGEIKSAAEALRLIQLEIEAVVEAMPSRAQIAISSSPQEDNRMRTAKQLIVRIDIGICNGDEWD